MVLACNASEGITTLGAVWQYLGKLENVHTQQSSNSTSDRYFQETHILQDAFVVAA